MSSTSIDTPTSPTTTMLDANEHQPYYQQHYQNQQQQQQQHQQQLQQQQHQQQQQYQEARHFHQYTTKAIVASGPGSSSGSASGSGSGVYINQQQQQQQQQYQQQQQQQGNIQPLGRQMNKESSLTPSSSNSSSVSANGSHGACTAAAVHIYNHNSAHDASSQSTQYHQIQQSQYPQAAQQQYLHNIARPSASFPNSSNIYSTNNSGAAGADVSGHTFFPSKMPQAHAHTPSSLNNIHINAACGNNLANHQHHSNQQYQQQQQLQHQQQQQLHQQQQHQQLQHQLQQQLNQQNNPNPHSNRIQHHNHQHGHNHVAVCCYAYGGNSSHVEHVAADVSYCSSSTSSCCSSSASVAGVVGATSSANGVGSLNALVGPVTPVIQQKLSRTIPSDKINLRLILVSGKTKEFLFNPTDSAGDIAQTVFDNWPEDWEREAVSKAEILRLIYQGRFLHCNVTLGALGLPLGKTTVMHLVPRDNLPEPNSQDQRQKSKGGSSRCCSTTCCIL